MFCMVARERTVGARRECLAQMFSRHVPDCREARRCVGPEQIGDSQLDTHDTPTLAISVICVRD